MFQSPGEIAFTIKNIDVYYYGIIMAVSIFAGLGAVLFLRKRFFPDISEGRIYDISFLLIIAGIIGARLYYAVMDYDYFIKFPYEILSLRNGGISIQGAILGAAAAGFIYLKRHKQNFLRYADLFVFGLSAGQILGRWGNFFNSEAFGMPVSNSLPWKLFIPYGHRPLEYRNYEFFHPAFLYESILSACIFAVLYLILTKYNKRRDGLIFYVYIILYSAARIMVESIRLDSVLNINGIHIAHIASAAFIVFAAIGLLFLYKGEKAAAVKE